MQSTLTETDLFRELDYRENDGIEVSLLWNPEDDSLAVVVNDKRTDTSFEVAVSPGDAREAFAHPLRVRVAACPQHARDARSDCVVARILQAALTARSMLSLWSVRLESVVQCVIERELASSCDSLAP
jgi:hypothetical protein